MKRVAQLVVIFALMAYCRADVLENSLSDDPMISSEPEMSDFEAVKAVEDLDELIPSTDIDAINEPSAGIEQTKKVTLDDTENIGPNQEAIGKLFCGSYYHRSYKSINEYLVAKSEDSDTTVNMELALEKLGNELAKANLFNKCHIAGLKQFIALAAVTPENKCSWESFKIIYMNDRATGGKTHRTPEKTGILNRIQNIVHRYSLGHAIDCQYQYPQIYERIISQMDKEKLTMIRMFLDNLVEKYMNKKGKFLFFETKKNEEHFDPLKLVKGIKSFKGDTASKLAYGTIRAYSRDDPDRRYLSKVVDELNAKMIVRMDKIKILMEKYLIEPCKYYLESLGPHVFIPANYDSLVLRREDRYSLNSPGITEFLHGWIRYRLCDVLVKDQQNNLAKGIAKVAEKTSGPIN